MSFLIAAAGTGGHVYPGLAVAEALMSEGVAKDRILFAGGDRLEATVYPENGFEFLQMELRGLKRSLSPSNLSLPRMVFRARDLIANEISRRGIVAALGLGGYVTIPTALAARKTATPLMISEQNAGAGLANRIASRWARRIFVSFPDTHGLASGEWVGNPVRKNIADFDRSELRPHALEHFGLVDHLPTVGVFGGSLGAASINNAVAEMVANWEGPEIQVVHLVGPSHETAFDSVTAASGVRWVRRGFEDRMDLFFAAIDLVISRAGGAVAEVIATGTPSILIPGDFGSSGHQAANATYLARHGAAVVLEQEKLEELSELVANTVSDAGVLTGIAESALEIAKPDAAKAIALAMIELAP